MMNLFHLSDIVASARTLEELERRNPKLAKGLEYFVADVVDICDKAYGELSRILGRVIALEDAATPAHRAELQADLFKMREHQWYKNVLNICAPLHALNATFHERLASLAEEKAVTKPERSSLFGLIHLLEKGEHDIEDDIEAAAGDVGELISKAARSGNAAPARKKAQALIDELGGNMRTLREAKQRFLAGGRRRATPESEPAIDFVIITALPEELTALMDHLPRCRRISPTEQDVRVYHLCNVQTRFPDGTKGAYAAVALSLLSMGRLEASNATGDAIRRWHPRYVLLVGIAGGIARADVELGDILVSDQIVDPSLQKWEAEGPRTRYNVHRVDPRLHGIALNLPPKKLPKRVRDFRPGEGSPNLHVGPILTGDKIIAKGGALDPYLEDWPKLIGVEMEAGGVASAAFQSPEHPGVFMVRGVSDLADEKKDTGLVRSWRRYAAEAAAAYAVMLLKSGPVPLSQ